MNHRNTNGLQGTEGVLLLLLLQKPWPLPIVRNKPNRLKPFSGPLTGGGNLTQLLCLLCRPLKLFSCLALLHAGLRVCDPLPSLLFFSNII